MTDYEGMEKTIIDEQKKTQHIEAGFESAHLKKEIQTEEKKLADLKKEKTSKLRIIFHLFKQIKEQSIGFATDNLEYLIQIKINKLKKTPRSAKKRINAKQTS